MRTTALVFILVLCTVYVDGKCNLEFSDIAKKHWKIYKCFFSFFFFLIFIRSGFEAQGCPESCTLCLRPWPLSKVSARHAGLFQTLAVYRSGKLTVEVGLVLRNESSCTSEARHSKTIPQYGGGGMTPAGIWPDSHFKYVIVDLLSILANNNDSLFWVEYSSKNGQAAPAPHCSCLILWHHSVQMLKTWFCRYYYQPPLIN